MSEYTYLEQLSRQVEAPKDGTLSRTILQDERLKAVLFNFSPGQELSEHTASTPAVMHFLEGEADVTVGGDAFSVSGDAWIHMTPQVPHSIRAKTRVVMLLLLIKAPPVV
jgi:quercetin dioxygenase-like cupin family protein